jgi:hypothetical protein
MRISVFLLAMALLIAYSVPAMSAECEKGQSCGQSCDKGGQTCGSSERACAGECGCEGDCGEGCDKSACEGSCGEGCECACEGDCGEGCEMGGECKMGKGCSKDAACACKSCKVGCPYGERCDTCMKRESCKIRGKCDKGGECPMGQGMPAREIRGMHPGMHRGMNRDMMMHGAQCAVDMKLELKPCQRMALHSALNKNCDMGFVMMEGYYGDRCMSLEELNHRLTRMNHKFDRRTRGMLNPMQDALFPEHMFMDYGSKAWGDSFHPGAMFAFRKLRDKYMIDYDDWGRGPGERHREFVIVEDEGE